MSGKLNIHEDLNNAKSSGAKVYHVFTREDCGRYADGSHGDAYVTRKAINLAIAHGMDDLEHSRDERSDSDDDAVFTDAVADALDHLNTLCEAGVSFQLLDGDLVLVADNEADC